MANDDHAPEELATPKRGAIPTPDEDIETAEVFSVEKQAPANTITIPPNLSFWGNNVHGDCVTAEEAFAKACHQPEIFITEQVVTDWARKHKVLEGAVILNVLKLMQKDGFRQDGHVYDDGPAYRVDWTKPAVLQAAIAQGPVKIGVAANQIEASWRKTYGRSGWFGLKYKPDKGYDHCVTLCGFGSIAWLAQNLKVNVPAGVDGTLPGYAMFTWNSIGIIDVPSVRAITCEAWIRRPTDVIK
jgi:hypothetical protein